MAQNGTPKPILTLEQVQFLELVASGVSASIACKQLGVPRRTFYGWRTRNADFKRAMEEALGLVWSHALARMKTLAKRAVDVFEGVMRDKNASARDRLRAAEQVLSNCHKAVADAELRARLEKVIQQLEGGNADQHPGPDGEGGEAPAGAPTPAGGADRRAGS